MNVRKALPAEAPVAAMLLQRGFPEDIRPFTIWHSPKLAAYLQHEIVTAGSNHRIFVLIKEGAVIGAISIRRLEDKIYPQVMFVDPAERGRGYGNLLLGKALDLFAQEHPDFHEVLWDVVRGESTLESWYARLGGEECDRKAWWVANSDMLGAHQTARPYEWSDTDDTRFGFSMLTVQTAGEAVSVGKLPGPYFRVLNADVLHDPRFLGTLHQMDPSRGILYIGQIENLRADWQSSPLFVTRQLKFRLDTLLQAFAQRQ